MRYFLHIGYNGAAYRGWQRQANVRSVQEVLETELTKMLNQRIIVHGCGRTDAKVHASQYFLHFDYEKEFDFDFVFRINKMLPDDIAVFEIIPVIANANAQLDAIRRTYDYFIHFNKDPFLSEFSSLYLLENLDFDKMKEAASLFTNQKDYHSLCLAPNTYNSTICEIFSSQLFINEKEGRLRFQITSNRFLRGLIRSIIGRLLEIGEGKLSVEELETGLKGGQINYSNKLAYPQGLYLSKVEYLYLKKEPRSDFSRMLENQLDKSWQVL
jgi:tRNA pseudouridine38-40 synthase